ncbi:heavy metal sensor histidine kinase [Oceanisphaera pacifica]|uniref:Sensor protein n=1 Tax=Oceanisphaera pacifica TaxID=2818389 RepID=A0ABS3NHQ2_9GAMM|nr:heavy metal sensor histidine kinase [Oceanisphaera pacifica]MBO1520114.1 heavy metal sensor histidine kinase [Oceanisphaera pacifica]
MLSHLSLTARLSLMFSMAMLAIWGVVSLVLIQALDHHFAQQDKSDIQSKIVLAKQLISEQLQSSQPTWPAIENNLNQMLVGHSGYYLLVSDQQGQTLACAAPTGYQEPNLYIGTKIRQLTKGCHQGGRRYRSMTASMAVDLALFDTALANIPTENKQDMHTISISVALDTRYHQHFINEIKLGLTWLTGAIALISILLGWLASRTGLKPLRSLASLSARVTADRLDHRLSLANSPPELHPSIQAFNDMLDRLEDSFQRLTAFSSDIAHELRTPINSLMMQTQVALAQPRHSEEYQETLYANLETAERLARMISELLFLAKSEQGQLTMQTKPLALDDELDELIEFFEPLASEHQVRLHRQGQASLLGDKSMLQRAFSNLLTNAIRYTPAQREVRIKISQHRQGVTVAIENPGPVIPPEKWAHLFDRFYQADHARQPTTEGTGLGLAITHAIITAHHGTISVHSDAQATCFSVWLPHT